MSEKTCWDCIHFQSAGLKWLNDFACLKFPNKIFKNNDFKPCEHFQERIRKRKNSQGALK